MKFPDHSHSATSAMGETPMGRTGETPVPRASAELRTGAHVGRAGLPAKSHSRGRLCHASSRMLGIVATRLSAAAPLMVLLLVELAWAGPYAPASGPSSAPDAGLPGFVGPAGDGVVDAANTVNPLFVAWAGAYSDYLPAEAVDSQWHVAARALGPVSGDEIDGVVSLGDLDATQIAAGDPPGRITLGFSQTFGDAAGPDLAVFENGYYRGAAFFAEVAYVEVSSDGTHFARFPSRSLTGGTVGAYGTIDATDVHNLAGKHANAHGLSWGTPFDLADLDDDPLVTAGLVDTMLIRYVRLVDIPGSGDWLDAMGGPIYDAWVTWGSGGFDLDAVGALHHSPGPGDANNDGLVDVADLGIMAYNWGHAGLPRWNQADFNKDGVVNVGDLGVLAFNWGSEARAGLPALPYWGSVAGQAAALPEPTSAGLLALAVASWSWGRSRGRSRMLGCMRGRACPRQQQRGHGTPAGGGVG